MSLAILSNPIGLGTGLAAGAGGLNYFGVKDTNDTNAQIARERNQFEMEEAVKARGFSGRQAARNRAFQRNMSSTAVRRRMHDMREGGINPILAARHEASTPSGAVGATAKANAHGYTHQNELGGLLDGIATAVSLKKMTAETKKVEAETKFTDRKKDMTDPLNSVMEMLQGYIDAGAGSAKDRKNMGSKAKENIERLINSMKSPRNKKALPVRDKNKRYSFKKIKTKSTRKKARDKFLKNRNK